MEAKKLLVTSGSFLLISAFSPGCGSADDADTTTSMATQQHGTDSAAPDLTDGTSTPAVSTVRGPQPTRGSSSGASDVETKAPENDKIAVLDGMTEVDTLEYSIVSINGGSGVNFTTPDGNISCSLTPKRSACYIRESSISWDMADRANDGVSNQMPESDMIGWNDDVEAPNSEAPKTWSLQGEFPKDGDTLPNDTKLTATISSRPDATVTCGVKDSEMICATDNHGFSINKNDYSVW